MLTIVEQLQIEAANSSGAVVTLLRRARVAAAKLGLGRLEAWMESELNGYKSKVPAFRKTRGQLRGWNPYNGWIPIAGDPKLLDKICSIECADPVGQLEEIVRRSDGGYAKTELGPHQVEAINDLGMPIRLPRYEVVISITFLTGILDEVRNRILDWALQLEREGIMGSNFSFSNEEKRKAQEVSQTTINVGSIGSMQGHLGSNNQSGDMNCSTLEPQAINRLLSEANNRVEELEKSGVSKSSF